MSGDHRERRRTAGTSGRCRRRHGMIAGTGSKVVGGMPRPASSWPPAVGAGCSATKDPHLSSCAMPSGLCSARRTMAGATTHSCRSSCPPSGWPISPSSRTPSAGAAVPRHGHTMPPPLGKPREPDRHWQPESSPTKEPNSPDSPPPCTSAEPQATQSRRTCAAASRCPGSNARPPGSSPALRNSVLPPPRARRVAAAQLCVSSRPLLSRLGGGQRRMGFCCGIRSRSRQSPGSSVTASLAVWPQHHEEQPGRRRWWRRRPGWCWLVR